MRFTDATQFPNIGGGMGDTDGQGGRLRPQGANKPPATRLVAALVRQFGFPFDRFAERGPVPLCRRRAATARLLDPRFVDPKRKSRSRASRQARGFVKTRSERLRSQCSVGRSDLGDCESSARDGSVGVPAVGSYVRVVSIGGGRLLLPRSGRPQRQPGQGLALPSATPTRGVAERSDLMSARL